MGPKGVTRYEYEVWAFLPVRLRVRNMRSQKPWYEVRIRENLISRVPDGLMIGVIRQSREWVTQKSVPKWDLSSSSLGLYITKPMIVANTATSLHATAFDQWDGSALSFRFVNFHSYQASWLSRRVGPCRRPNRIDCCRTRKCATSDKLCRSGSRRSRPREWNLWKCHSWSRWISWKRKYREVSKRSSWWRCRVSFVGREWPGAWSGREGNDWIVPFQTKEKEELVGWECRRQSWRPRRERAGTGTATSASHTPWSRSHWSAGESHWSGAGGVDQCRRRQGRRRRNWRAHSDNHSKRCPEMEWSVEENTHKNSTKLFQWNLKLFSKLSSTQISSYKLMYNFFSIF